MINLEELKPILEVLIDGREDSADIIEQVTGLDKPVEVDRSEIDALNASWNERFKKQFFGEKADSIDDTIPTVSEVKEEDVVEEVTGDNITYDDLFTEVKEKEED